MIPTQVMSLANPRIIMERRKTRGIAASSTAFLVNGSMVAQSLVKKNINTVGVWYRVETYTIQGPNG